MRTLHRGLRILLYGKDARTDAIAEACLASELVPELFAYSEFTIPGLVQKCVHLESGPRANLVDLDSMERYARAVRPDLVIIGPEEPLAAGLVDRLDRLGLQSFGPPKNLALVEASKSWTRLLLTKHGIVGNPAYRIFDTTNGLREYLSAIGDFVVKPDGLTGGKGVRVLGEHLASREEAYEYASSLLPHSPVVIEERLVGEEFSLQTITDGNSFVHCPAVQDHKRAYEGDTGPNTGGMGSYSDRNFSLPFLGDSDLAAAQRINEQVVRALNRETGRPYRGVLYGGFIATAEGVKLIEYNCRFGDPEAMNVLPLLRTDFVEMAWAVTQGSLDRLEVEFAPKATVCKYLVPEKYPLGKSDGEEIHVPEALLSDEHIRLYWAATNAEADRVLLTGSRALAVVGIGSSLIEAEQFAEKAASLVEGPVRHRRDIGTPELIATRVNHMRELRTPGGQATLADE